MTPEQLRIRQIVASWPRCVLCSYPLHLNDARHGVEVCDVCDDHLRILVPSIDVAEVPLRIREAVPLTLPERPGSAWWST